MKHRMGACEKALHSIKFVLLGSLLSVMAIGSLRAWPIPDTGQTKCYNDLVEITCPAPGQPFYGQDGNNTINPPSYTKLDATGAALPSSATTWAMVKDNVTGLIWENKTYDGGIHDILNLYSWCDKNPVTNGGDEGKCSGGVTLNYSDTEFFLKVLNDDHFGGFSDWRLPTVKQLTSIVDYSREDPAINSNFFISLNMAHWSSTTLYGNVSSRAFAVHFPSGGSGSYEKYFPLPVRAVRGGQSGSFRNLVDNGDGTVTDTATGLMWQQLTPNIKLSWEAALLYGEILGLAEYDDWRMPTAKEHQSILVFNGTFPAIDTTFFPGTMSNYWSSTSGFGPYFGPDAWSVNPQTGGDIDIITHHKSNKYYVRAVRGGQSQLSGQVIISAPGQADKWNIGEHKTITWDNAGIAGKVKISLSRQGGKAGTFETIIASTENNGLYNWTVTGPVSVNSVLKIEPLDDPSKATSQGLFAISDDYVGLHWLPLILRN